jgi:sucrose phosphorylase
MKRATSQFHALYARIHDYLKTIYAEHNHHELAKKVMQIMGPSTNPVEVEAHKNLWDESDVLAITYGDSIRKADEKPLKTLHQFLTQELDKTLSTVHILPFYPFSSDDGFAVINYVEVNHGLGNWQDIENIAADFDLMADLVINHCSSRSLWFENFRQQKQPGKDYFITCDPDTDLSDVTRPRTNELLRETETLDGTKHVWCTFSHDQVDLDFSNPEVLLEIIGIIKHYLDHGITLFRLDAVAFLWKEIGTSCINLHQTHEIIRLLRLIIEHINPKAIIITETNIPNRENLAYFGNANEAHWIYNFTLPPLVLYSLLYGKSDLLKQWMMSMPPAQNGTAYFNFIASHDGIGLRPVEDILSEQEVDQMAALMRQFGGDVSFRTMPDGTVRPYELNISLIDALKGTFDGEDDYQLQRFICAHAIMLALEGVPAFYIHSLLGTPNDHERKEASGNNRAINRHQWDYHELLNELGNDNSLHHKVFTELKKLITIRRKQKAFHPNATQFTLHLGDNLFAFWRQSIDRRQSIFCIYNISNQPQTLALKDVNLIELDRWFDLIDSEEFDNPRETVELKPYEFLWISN